MGRNKKTPDQLHAAGTARPDRAVRIPKPTDGDGPWQPVEKLTGTAAVIWRKVTGYLNTLDTYEASMDAYMIHSFCLQYGIYLDAMAEVKKSGAVILFVQGEQEMETISPHYKVAKEAHAIAMSIAKEMGLTAASRRRLNLDLVSGDEPEDEFSF